VKEGEPRKVITHPIGIGKVGWATPEGTTKVVSKRKNPIWTPPDSVRKEHAEAGDPLPRRVPPGPDNPLGAFAMNLGWPSYLIHGTNKPYGVGMRSSHGCLRFYPEDIALLFDQIPVGTRVHVVNQPTLVGWHNGAIYMQSFPALEDNQAIEGGAPGAALSMALTDRLWQLAKPRGVVVDLESVAKIARDVRGIATPVTDRSLLPEQYLAAAPRVHNRIPSGATWDGREELLVTAEEYEAVRDGKPLPKKPQSESKTKKEPAVTTGSAASGGASQLTRSH
jgi:L,D-transpeptidase ErfK/SrfK